MNTETNTNDAKAVSRKQTHEYSKCAKEVIDEYFLGTGWRDDLSNAPDAFQRQMWQCQIDLICCHFDGMNDEDKVRAYRTVQEIQDYV